MGDTVNTAAAEAAVVFACAWCGKSVVVEASEDGEQIVDAKKFLEAHRGCLDRTRHSVLREEAFVRLPP